MMELKQNQWQEMAGTMKKLKRKKSRGPDGIPNEIFIEANIEITQLLNTVIKNIRITEDIRHMWKWVKS